MSGVAANHRRVIRRTMGENTTVLHFLIRDNLEYWSISVKKKLFFMFNR